MGKVYTSITQLVGNTPLLELVNYEKAQHLEAKILVKLESFNPNHNVKERVALAMIEDAERDGRLKPSDTIVEVSSGNTGIGLAAIAAAKGYKFRVYMQDGVSEERTKMIKAFGGTVIKMSEDPLARKSLEESGGDFIGTTKVLERELFSKEENLFFTNQFENDSNPDAHRKTTGPEIWNDTDGKIDFLVAGVGTGGTITGLGEYLKEKNPKIKIIGFQPGVNSLPSEENPDPEQIMGVHPFVGIPENFIPKVLNQKIYDEVFEVETADAYKAARAAAKTDGIFVGTSSGAAIHVAVLLAQRPENRGKVIVAILPDTGLEYLSTNLFET